MRTRTVIMWSVALLLVTAALLMLIAAVALGAEPPKDVQGWQATRWGMDTASIEAIPGLGIVRLDKREEAKNFYADLAVPTLEVCGESFKVALQMAKSDNRLAQVFLDHHGKSESETNLLLPCLEVALVGKYGPPAARSERGAVVWTITWVFPTTTIELARFPMMNFVSIRYFPTAKSGAAGL